MKKTITRAEYLQLVGLLTLASHHEALVKECERSARALIGERDENSEIIADEIWGRETFDANRVLKTAGIEVVEEPETAQPPLPELETEVAQ